MNDRFKFRVWDKGNKRYQGTQDWQPYLDTDGDVCFINTDDVRNYPPENYFIIEQCTGLKDKNGNLIYEGDIIKDEFYRRFTIVWSEEDCLFEGRVIYRDPEYSDRFDLYKGATDNCEIIGNVHEQAEQKDNK